MDTERQKYAEQERDLQTQKLAIDQLKEDEKKYAKEIKNKLERFFQEAREDFDSKAHSPKKSSDSPGHVTGGGSGHVKLKKVTDYKLKKIVCPKKRGHL